jgi:hypothetical protein
MVLIHLAVMETMYTACDTKPNITTDSTAFFEIKAKDGDLFNSQVETATGQSAPTATGKLFPFPPTFQASTIWCPRLTREKTDI